MIEIDCVSLNIIKIINRNNDILINISSKVKSLNKEIDNGKMTIKRIFKRENKNKLMIEGITMILIIFFIFFVTYY